MNVTAGDGSPPMTTGYASKYKHGIAVVILYKLAYLPIGLRIDCFAITFQTSPHLQGPEAQPVVPRAGERQEKSPAVTAVHPTCHST